MGMCVRVCVHVHMYVHMYIYRYVYLLKVEGGETLAEAKKMLASL